MASYDVIVVGSGSAGGALAARLSENPDCRVLVLEAGPVYRSVEEMPDELLLPTRIGAVEPGNPHNWAMQGELRPGRTMPYPRGKVLGGSSSINGCYFIRGTREDFDRWASLGNDAWSYDELLPYFKRMETDHDFSDEFHGHAGPIPVRREPTDRAPEFVPAFEAACAALGFSPDPDKNAPSSRGVGPTPMNVHRGRRVGTALGYLIPAMARSNLTVIGGAVVQHVRFDNIRAVGVDAVIEGAPATFHGSEIVVACGALRTPHLLMHSGIGPAAHLRAHGIDVVADLAGVGRNLTDHAVVQGMWQPNDALQDMAARGAITSVVHWRGSEGDEMEVFPLMQRSEFDLGEVARLEPGRRPAFMPAKVFHAQSRGTVTLASDDPNAMPVLRWNLLSTDRDRRTYRELVRTVYEIFDARPMRELGARMVGISRDTIADNRALDDWIASNITSGHPCCTCRMGPESDAEAVVDQELRVRGVDGLRVADTSAFPTITSRGPAATAIMLGERAADLIDGSARPANSAMSS